MEVEVDEEERRRLKPLSGWASRMTKGQEK